MIRGTASPCAEAIIDSGTQRGCDHMIAAEGTATRMDISQHPEEMYLGWLQADDGPGRGGFAADCACCQHGFREAGGVSPHHWRHVGQKEAQWHASLASGALCKTHEAQDGCQGTRGPLIDEHIPEMNMMRIFSKASHVDRRLPTRQY